MTAATATDRPAPQRWRARTAVALWLTAVALALAGSTLQPHDSPALYRFWSNLPGITDVCGDFTWLARAVPPGIALLGTVFLLTPRPSRRTLAIGAVGILVAVGLGFAVAQNAVPWGEQQCIVD
jgi:hypothetical protein